MNQYRKSDQYYIDNYDRSTIRELKQMEVSDGIKWSEIYCNKHAQQHKDYDPFNKFYMTAIRRAKIKDSVIQSQISSDERKDRLVRHNPIPKNIQCNYCNSQMIFELHMFKEDDTQILFVFNCPKGHLPKKAIYKTGIEYIFPKSKCKICGGDFSSEKKELPEKLIFTETCNKCGNIVVDEYDLSSLKEEPIDEDDRKKYCTHFIGKRDFWDDLKATGDLQDLLDKSDKEKLLKEEYEVDKIEKINIPKLEQRLVKLAEELGYIKFQFETPDTKRQLIVTFNTQDPTDKNETESIKLLTKAIKKDLLSTNWRLMTNGISYRMGYLSGQLKAYESDEDLLKIAKEIQDHKTAKSKK